MKNIILADFNVNNDWNLKKGLEDVTKEEWEVISFINNGLHKNIIKKINKYINLFLVPLKIILKRKHYKRIVAWQQFYGLNFAFFSRLFRIKKINDLTVMTFIYKEKKGILGKIYYSYIKYILHSGYIDRIIVYSKNEVNYYNEKFNLREDYIFFCKLGIDSLNLNDTNCNNTQKYILSAGKSNRDYNFLIDCLKDTEYNVKIICKEHIEVSCDNIEIYERVNYNEYIKLLQNSYCVIIPLMNENISSGQLVILEAMQLGKPVIVTENKTVRDYIVNNNTGFIINKDKEELMICLNELYLDSNKYNEISQNDIKEFNENYSVYNLGVNVGKLIIKN